LAHIRYELENFLLAGPFELSEDSRPIASLEARNATAELLYGKLILSCWGDGWSRSWRILRAELNPQTVRLECSRQMGRVLTTLELTRTQQKTGPVPRDKYAGKLAALIETNLASVKVERAILRRDDRRSFSGIQTRLELRDRGKPVAGIGVSATELQTDIDATLGAGLVWLDAMRKRYGVVDRLMIFLPSGRADTIAARLTMLNIRGATVTLHEVDEAESRIAPLAPFDQGDLNDRLKQTAMRAEWPHEQQLPLDAMMLVDSIQRLAPDLIKAHRQGAWALLSIRGLEFARVSLRRRIVEFGVGTLKEKLKLTNQVKLERLIQEIARTRRSDPVDRNDLLYREYAERWLESILEQDISAIDPTLDRRYAYSQVPTYRGEQRSFIDLLSVTQDGRLVVIELKVSEDPEFPYQGLDYWLRVEWHRRRGDFGRRGYFKQIKLLDAPPLLYLVAPVFRFHATTGMIAGAINDAVQVTRIGINDDWRNGVKVLLTERLNGDSWRPIRKG
jgi:hypothetical protein